MTQMIDTSYIRTFTGKYFYPSRPEELDIDIRDIAHALSNVCRYNGHLPAGFYSVAQHSVLVSKRVPYELKLAALLHDATEAYLPDVPSPIKKILPDFRALEERLASHISKWAGVNTHNDPVIKEQDVAIREVEMGSLAHYWGESTYDGVKLVPHSPAFAEYEFLTYYYKYIMLNAKTI